MTGYAPAAAAFAGPTAAFAGPAVASAASAATSRFLSPPSNTAGGSAAAAAAAAVAPSDAPFDAAHRHFPHYQRYVDVLAALRETCETRPWQRFQLRFSCDPALVLFLWHVCATATDTERMRAEIEGWLSPLITSVASLPQHQRRFSHQLTLHRPLDWYQNFSPHLAAELVNPFETAQTVWCGAFRHTGMTFLSEVSVWRSKEHAIAAEMLSARS